MIIDRFFFIVFSEFVGIENDKKNERNLIIARHNSWHKVFSISYRTVSFHYLFHCFIQIHKEVAHRQVDNRFMVRASYRKGSDQK